MKAVCLWSGGKDSCFACYKALNLGYEICALFNFTKLDTKSSLSHGLSSGIILRQAQMTHIPVIQKAMPQETYRQEFIRLITEWKKEQNIEAIVFGDIFLQEHKDWIDAVCQELKVEAILPLWGEDTKKLIEEFINLGFEAIVVTTMANHLGSEWLGRKIDKGFLTELDPEIDPCGERGEFHTFVYNGPIFKAPIKFKVGRKWHEDNRWFLEVF